ncbi:pyridoxal phosphate-dependent aminotransferase [Ruminiclostridium cellobioparum]|uniref:Aspartate/tyrosine/aromatic aminotransferase n=1 Tax=Ruminiclostridium cellobioparum subsp. termitidis CT1112 TaxID=1195236 RepID=S0FW92_RUMCE|nr:pyridoxal phosphate-dependent aminotransferase [Ruminiclostridium cellobioparum]EMS73434.1 Aspartate/tyrosine/aromatic aminotransferase [Ruminiclostridium cellobioparum subsp. termitidis CT1112]
MISNKISNRLANSSMIRAMFEEGARLKKIYGADKVYDFSLGNPDPEPPAEVKAALRELANSKEPGMHLYMNNAGYTEVRETIAGKINRETGLQLTFNNVVMTVGAGGALNIVLKTLLNPDEEVIIFAPYFVEYTSYIDNHGGKAVIVNTDSRTFLPDPELLRSKITPNTKAILINTPNNPTGVVYGADILKAIANVLEEKGREYGHTIYIISDEPYRKLAYDVNIPNILTIYRNAIMIDCFSKSLSLPGERMGYIAANPEAEDIDTLMGGLIYCNRVLGYVNAPALFQKVIARTIDSTVDINIYKERRDLLYNGLTNLGYECVKPDGAFYLFPKSLIADDVEFKNRAVKYNLLIVPGSGFGCPGHFRLAYCVSLETIKNSLPAFEALAKEFK